MSRCKPDDLCALVGKERLGVDEQRSNPMLDERSERQINLAFRAGFADHHGLPERRRRRLYVSRIRLSVRIFRIDEEPITAAFGTRSCSRSISLPAKPLTRKLTPVMFAARSVEACNDAEFDRVAAHRKDDRDRRGHHGLGLERLRLYRPWPPVHPPGD